MNNNRKIVVVLMVLCLSTICVNHQQIVRIWNSYCPIKLMIEPRKCVLEMQTRNSPCLIDLKTANVKEIFSQSEYEKMRVEVSEKRKPKYVLLWYLEGELQKVYPETNRAVLIIPIKNEVNERVISINFCSKCRQRLKNVTNGSRWAFANLSGEAPTFYSVANYDDYFIQDYYLRFNGIHNQNYTYVIEK